MVRTLSGIGSSEKFRRYDLNISPRVINTSFVHTYLYGLIISKILRKIKGFKRFYILLDRKIAVCELYLIPLFMFDFLVTKIKNVLKVLPEPIGHATEHLPDATLQQ